MKIITWQSEDAPPSHKWLARFLIGTGFLPTVVTGPTEEKVIERAEAFIESERKRLNARTGKKPDSVGEALVERLGKPDPVIDVEGDDTIDILGDLDLLADL
jgi:hypothetical protein